MKPDCLIINSYAGSLLIAATQLGLKVRGSYEDTGYGMDIQKDNFKGIKFVDTLEAWPKDDLSKTVVIAHPPCKVFSIQAGRARNGVNGEAFNCTINVMKYALGQKAMVLALESVPGAMEGARQVHDEYARRYGYIVLRILQNACTLGVPQWRPRFWAVFVRKDLFKAPWVFGMLYKKASIGQVIDGLSNGGVKFNYDPKLEEQVAEQRRRLLHSGFTKGQVDRLFRGINRADNEDYGYLAALIQREIGYKGNVLEMSKKYCHKGKYMCSGMRVLNPNELTSTVLYDAWWMLHGKPLPIEGYKAAMGFPVDYKMPAKKYREYLSRGVCPPVAKWLLEQIYANLDGPRNTKAQSQRLLGKHQLVVRTVKDGEVADFSVNRTQWAKALKQEDLCLE